ncbi:MAG: prolipoprotein diacylglyceryl transferase [Spirochaetales bacterium]
MILALNYPSWIQPEIFPGVPVLGLIRWYGLMYIFAFGTAIIVFRKLCKEGMLNTPTQKTTDDDVFSFFSYGIVGLLLGARIFGTLVYDTSGMYWQKPWLIFWPFNPAGQFTGFTGMSYHGGFVGGFIGMVVWCLVKKRPMLKWIDAMGIAIPLGYTFGRLGNFFNAELYGRITTMPWGIIFPTAPKFSLSIPWVEQVAAQAGIPITPETVLVNLPRHPSQLYEALFEGIILFIILWLLRKHNPFDGFLTSIYTMGYGLFRFVIEYFREPDADIGYRITAVPDAPIYFNQSVFNISTGQIFCLIMIFGGLGLLVIRFIQTKQTSKSKKQRR